MAVAVFLPPYCYSAPPPPRKPLRRLETHTPGRPARAQVASLRPEDRCHNVFAPSARLPGLNCCRPRPVHRALVRGRRAAEPAGWAKQPRGWRCARSRCGGALCQCPGAAQRHLEGDGRCGRAGAVRGDGCAGREPEPWGRATPCRNTQPRGGGTASTAAKASFPASMLRSAFPASRCLAAKVVPPTSTTTHSHWPTTGRCQPPDPHPLCRSWRTAGNTRSGLPRRPRGALRLSAGRALRHNVRRLHPAPLPHAARCGHDMSFHHHGPHDAGCPGCMTAGWVPVIVPLLPLAK